jgi:hypothetical protein
MDWSKQVNVHDASATAQETPTLNAAAHPRFHRYGLFYAEA